MSSTESTGQNEAAGSESFEFQAETRQLLDIVIHSLYSNKEIFLRELISNASDAIDRLRFEALTDAELLQGDSEFEIRLEADPDQRTLSISDNGIGMSRDEVIANIGTIAKSGTRELMKRIKESKSTEVSQLIGQFGVGFYSAFMVADRVTLVTRRAGDEKATRWESTGDGSYTLSEDQRFLRGTTVILHLKPTDEDHGIEDLTQFYTVQNIVKKHSDFVSYPVKMKNERQEPELDGEGKPIEGKTKLVVDDVTLNSMKPIWMQSKEDLEDEELTDFYKHISHDWNEPLDSLMLRAEGRIEYRALLYLPSKAPFDLFYRDQTYGLRLYVRRILIMDRCEELLPPFLRFVRGVVDSDDLPINISREMVQQDRHIQQMRKWLTRKVLDHLKELQKNKESSYLEFWAQFGRVLKEGVGFEADQKDKVAPLLYFESSNDSEALTTLDAYIERMKDDQEAIYYLSGDSRTVVENSPHLEAFRDKGYEVLYLVDPVDEIVTQALTEYSEKPLKSVGKGNVELGTEEEKKEAEEKLEDKQKTHGDLLSYLQKLLDDEIKEVRLSNRLTTSPVCLVSGEHDLSPQLERLLRQTEGADSIGKQKRIMELNPEHEILSRLQTCFDSDPKDPRIGDYGHLLLGYALLAEGSDLPDPSRFNRLVAELMIQTL